MAFLLVGLVLLALKWAEIDPVAGWAWWIVLLPFGLAVAWWAFADSTGLTTRRAMDKMDKRKADRRKRDMEALGLVVKPQVRRPGTPAAGDRAGKPPGA